MKFRRNLAVLLCVSASLTLLVTGCAAPQTQSGPPPSASVSPSSGMGHGGPPECPAKAEISAPPKRVVTMDAAAAAILIELGLGDRLVGTAGPDFIADYAGELRSKLDSLKVIDPKGRGNAELVLAEKPDFVTGISAYEFGAFPGTPTVALLKQNGAAALAACDTAKDSANRGIDSTYNYITELARVFQVADRGTQLINKLKSEVSTAAAKANGKSAVPVLALSTIPDVAKGVMTNGGTSLANGIISLAGGENIAGKQLKDFVNLSAEQIAKADPAVLVVVSGFAKQSDEELRKAIISSPTLASTKAVKTGNVVIIPQRYLLSASVLNPRAVETIASAVAKA